MNRHTTDGLTRAEWLRTVAAMAVGGTLVTGCGSTSAGAGTGVGAASQTSATSTALRRGGSIQAAIGSVSTSENLDPTHLWNQNEFFYQPQIYDPFLIVDDRFRTYPVLAESWKPNAKIDEWTIKLRPGVRFHDGEPLTSRDAAYTLEHILEPSVGAPQYASWSLILDREGISTPDALTLKLRLKQPASSVPLMLGAGISTVGIMREGTKDFTKSANGTGPFKLASFVPGQSWEVERNPAYWQRGLPHLDSVRGVAVTDSSTKAQSVLTGQSQIADQLDFSLAKLFNAGGAPATLLVDRAVTEPYIILDTRHAPFDDNRVRMAFKLAMNRRLITTTAYQGHSVFTSDTPAALTDAAYPPGLGVRAQEIAQAKRLLSEAGYPQGLSVDLHTSDLIGGLLDMTTAFAQTVRAAGIHVNLHVDNADTYYEKVWREVPMYASWVYHNPPAVRLPLSFTSDGAWQETQYKGTPVDGWVKQGYRAADAQAQLPIWQKALRWISENEGYLNPGFADGLFPAVTKLRGVEIYIGLVRLGAAGLAS